MTRTQAWIKAMRLRTLPLALSSVGMAAFLAAFYHQFSLPVFVMSMVTTLLLQVLSNLANDYGDSKSGVDHVKREGPSRVVQDGFISMNEMLGAIKITTILTFLSGIILLVVSFDSINYLFLGFLILGICAIIAALKYTIGANPYGYKGLGDVFVLIFFGLIAVFGSFYLHTNIFHWEVVFPSVSFGLLSTGVLNVNNIRDIKSDKEAGKYSIPVRIGRKKAVVYHWILLSGSILFVIVFTLLNYKSWWQFLFVLTVPLFIRNGKAVYEKKSAKDLDPFLKQLAISTSIFTVAFGIGLLLS